MQPTLEELVDNFSLFDDWEERYKYLIDLGKTIMPIPESLKTENNLVRGCTSKVWLICKKENNKYHIIADSDAHIVKGLVAILLFAFNDKTAQEIAAVDIKSSFQAMGLDQHLSPNRRNGFYAMVERIQTEAI